MRLDIEFTHADGMAIPEFIEQKISNSIEKVYQAEYEKEQKDLVSINEAQKKHVSDEKTLGG